MPNINAKCQEAQNYAKKHNYAKYGNLVSTLMGIVDCMESLCLRFKGVFHTRWI